MADEHSQPEPRSDTRRAYRDPRHTLEYWIFGFVVITAIATTIAAIYTREQWKTANLAMIVSERSFVSVSNKSISAVLDPKKGWGVMVDISLNNSGNTRTRDFEFVVKCAKSTESLLEPWGLFRQERLEHRPNVLPPKGTVHAICGFTLDEAAQMAAGKIVGYVLGEVRYRDVFTDARHVTQFVDEAILVSIEPEPNPSKDSPPIRGLSMQWQNKGKHNCADEDCPLD